MRQVIIPLPLAAAYFAPRKGSKYAKRRYKFEIVTLRARFLIHHFLKQQWQHFTLIKERMLERPGS